MNAPKHHPDSSVSRAFCRLVDIVHRLRAPGGCPWDRKQTPESLKQYIVEEAYEVLDAIDSGDPDAVKEELGDLVLQVVLQAEIASERQQFAIEHVLDALSDKLIHRHPHVFGEVRVNGADEVISNWEKIKQKEKKDRGLFDGLPGHLPALQMAGRIGEKAARVGFDWTDIEGVRAKVDEELEETDRAVTSGDPAEIAHEIGDVLFAVAQWARHLGVQPEEALRACCGRFRTRFASVESDAKRLGVKLHEMGMERLEALWQKAKRT